MNLKKIILTFSCIIALYSCADYTAQESKKKEERQYYSSNGFALIYEDNLYLEKIINKKIRNDEIKIMHKMKNNLDINITYSGRKSQNSILKHTGNIGIQTIF